MWLLMDVFEVLAAGLTVTTIPATKVSCPATGACGALLKKQIPPEGL